MEENVIEVDFNKIEEEAKETPEEVEEIKLAPMTQEEFEALLIRQGILMPAGDVHHYMVRNASYMLLINSEEFKASGLNLEEILTDEFILAEQKKVEEQIKVMRYVTEITIPKMNETLLKDAEEEDPTQLELQLEEATKVAKEMIND